MQNSWPWRLGTAVVAMVIMLLAALQGGSVAAASAETLASPRKVTAWLPYWDQARGLQSFLAHADLYSSVSPFWYEMSPTAGVTRYPGAEDPTVLSGIRGKGVKVVPTITNNFDPVRVTTMLATSTSRAVHIRALTDLAAAHAYDGLDVDYEGLAAADRDRFSAFVSELATALRAQGRLLSVAVHAKTAEPGTWSGPQAQNYAAIGAAADRVRLMAYDYSWETSPAGPIAPLSWVDSVAAFAVTQIPAGKVELGMSLYGYDWVGSRGEGITHDVAAARLASSGATRVWDSAAAEPTFSYTSSGAAHTVYYADAQSVTARLAVVDKHALAAAAFWRLGGEDPAVWTAVRNRWGTSPTPVTQPVAAYTVSLLSPSRGTAGGSGQHTVTVTNTSGKGDARRLTISFEGGSAQSVVSVRTPDSTAWTCVLSEAARCTWTGGLAAGATTQVMSVQVSYPPNSTTTAESRVRVYADDLLVASGATQTALG